MTQTDPPIKLSPVNTETDLIIETGTEFGTDSTSDSRASKIWTWVHRLLPVFALLIFGIAIYFIHHLLKQHSYKEIADYVASIPRGRSISAVLLTVLSYAVLSGYDFMAFSYIRKKLPAGKIAFASFTAFAFSNNIGLANLAGSSIRLRIYSNYGIEPKDTLKVIAFVSASFWVGFFCLAGVMLTVSPVQFPPGFMISNEWVRAVGIVLTLLGIAYFTACGLRKEPLVIRGHVFRIPPFKLSLLQAALAATDWAIACYVLFLLLPEGSGVTYPQFLSIFISAQVVAILAHVPGGVGVLEALVIYFVSPDHKASTGILAALLTYRAVYYIFPLIVAAVGLVSYELYRQRHTVAAVQKRYLSWTGLVVPQAASVVAFLAGIVLIMSGVTPSMTPRLDQLVHFLPLSLIEISHFLASCVGAALLILSRALLSRSNAAWFVTLVALSAGAALSLAKGLDWEEAMILTACAVLLFASRSQFHRKSLLLSRTFSLAWLASVAMVVAGSIWMGFFVHRHVEYENDLWWTFAINDDAPRFLRASFGVIATSMALAFAVLLRPRRRPAVIPHAEINEIESIVRRSGDTVAHLALMGDKSILLNDAKDAFIMYSIRGSTWVALGDPIGNPESFEDLVYDFKQLADEYGGQVVFYEIKPEDLPLYIDLGMIFIKLGEEATVPLANFGLEGAVRKSLRHSYNKMKKLGVTFEIFQPEAFEALEPKLHVVSDKWLAQKQTREKGFSLGCYDPDYLRRFPIACLVQNGEVIAFTNLLTSESREELSIDLMRFDPGAPSGTMEQLTVEVMLWGKQNNYQSFNLGMAPLSGMEVREYMSKWNRSAQLLFDHGERFYNFQGLRAYKEKFSPEWRPRFLAYPGKLSLPMILADLTLLISGGAKGIVSR